MKKLLLTLTLVSWGGMNLIHANPRVPIMVQNQLNEERPQRWNNLSLLGKTRVYTANGILIPFTVGYVASALFAPEPVTKGLEKVFGRLANYLEKQTEY